MKNPEQAGCILLTTNVQLDRELYYWTEAFVQHLYLDERSFGNSSHKCSAFLCLQQSNRRATTLSHCHPTRDIVESHFPSAKQCTLC